MVLGPALRRARINAGLTLKDTAAEIGTSHQYLSKLERAQAEPSLQVLRRLDELFHFPQEILLRVVRGKGVNEWEGLCTLLLALSLLT